MTRHPEIIPKAGGIGVVSAHFLEHSHHQQLQQQQQKRSSHHHHYHRLQDQRKRKNRGTSSSDSQNDSHRTERSNESATTTSAAATNRKLSESSKKKKKTTTKEEEEKDRENGGGVDDDDGDGDDNNRKSNRQQQQSLSSSSSSSSSSSDEESSSSTIFFYTSPPLKVALDATPSKYRSDEFIHNGRMLAATSSTSSSLTTATRTTKEKEDESNGDDEDVDGDKVIIHEECTPTTCQIIFDPSFQTLPLNPNISDDDDGSSTESMSDVGVIIYGGGFVDPRSYSAIASRLADDYGIPTVIEIFDNDIAYDVSYIMEALKSSPSSDDNGGDGDGDSDSEEKESSTRSRMCDIYSSGRLELAAQTDFFSSSLDKQEKQKQQEQEQEQEQEKGRNTVKQWVLVGHSLGGVAVMADVWNYYHDHIDEYRRQDHHNFDCAVDGLCENGGGDGGRVEEEERREGIHQQHDAVAPLVGGFVLAGTYPRIELGCGTLNFSNVDVPAASVIGSNDGILNMTAYKESKTMYWNTDQTFFLNITGGNHEQFGSYDSLERQQYITGGRQTDGHATISSTVQQHQFIGAILNVVSRVQSRRRRRRRKSGRSSVEAAAERRPSSSSTTKKDENDQKVGEDGSRKGTVHQDGGGGGIQGGSQVEHKNEVGEKDDDRNVHVHDDHPTRSNNNHDDDRTKKKSTDENANCYGSTTATTTGTGTGTGTTVEQLFVIASTIAIAMVTSTTGVLLFRVPVFIQEPIRRFFM